MKKRIMKNLVAVVVIIAMISITACGRNKTNDNNTEENGSNTGDNTQQDNTTEDNVGTGGATGIADQYNTLLQGNPSREDVYGFIDKNITSASEDEADQLVNGVLGYEDTYENVDYTRLYAYKNYVSDEVEDFLELMYENEQTPYMDNNKIGVTLDELLDRAEDFEKHITEFPDGITTQPSYEMYCNIMNAAITGGYDKANNVPSFYKGDADNRIDGRAVDEYMKFLADEVDDGNEDQVSTNDTTNNGKAKSGTNTNTTNSNAKSGTNTNTTTNNTTNTKANKNTNSDSAANIEANTSNGANNTNGNNNGSTNSNTTNGTSTNNTTNNNTTMNVTGDTANIGDNSETDFTAPVTRSIVKDYVDLLAKTNNEITTEVETFYTNLNTLISEKFDL